MLIEHADTARGTAPSDLAGVVGAVNDIGGPTQIHGARAERVVRPCGHEMPVGMVAPEVEESMAMAFDGTFEAPAENGGTESFGAFVMV